MSAPRPEGMSERQLELCRELIETDDEVTRHDDSWPLLPKGAARDLLAEVTRLRADGATLHEQRQQIGGAFLAIQRITQPLGVVACSLDLPTAIHELAQVVRKAAEADGATLLHRAEQAETTAGDAKREIDRLVVRCGEFSEAHAASFKALHTLSAALFDGEVDDYAALAEKVIARVRQAEADGATLRERVRELTAWVENEMQCASRTIANTQTKGPFEAFYAATGLHAAYRATLANLASAPKEPTPHG